MPEDQPNLDSLFEAAVEIESGKKRAVFLDKSCGDDLELRKQVEQLLKSDEHAGSFLDKPPAELDVTILTDVAGESGSVSQGRSALRNYPGRSARFW